ncbi:MAG: hypothetical protein KF884_08685 [Fimbriimonadaceae bacterium]|nr:hypothetical protein [Fimbriimonadaceae bacterium]QYK57625.1 MAG: hypothetical protein KF884_08685 [Fimbriimonadaceae bacterium]
MRPLVAIIPLIFLTACQSAPSESATKAPAETPKATTTEPGLTKAVSKDKVFSMAVPDTWLAFDLADPKFKAFFEKFEANSPEGAAGMKQAAESDVAHFIRIDTSVKDPGKAVISNVNVHSIPFGEVEPAVVAAHAKSMAEILGSDQPLDNEVVQLPAGKAGHHWGLAKPGSQIGTDIGFDTWLLVDPKSKKGYTVTFTFPATGFDANQKLARKMVETISFSGS